jgi:hypothetical protein
MEDKRKIYKNKAFVPIILVTCLFCVALVYCIIVLVKYAGAKTTLGHMPSYSAFILGSIVSAIMFLICVSYFVFGIIDRKSKLIAVLTSVILFVFEIAVVYLLFHRNRLDLTVNIMAWLGMAPYIVYRSMPNNNKKNYIVKQSAFYFFLASTLYVICYFFYHIASYGMIIDIIIVVGTVSWLAYLLIRKYKKKQAQKNNGGTGEENERQKKNL